MSETTATADLYDANEETAQVLAPGYLHYGGIVTFNGPIATVKCFEDNSRVREMIRSPGEGRVLVVDGGGSSRCALFGDQAGEAATKNGWAGILVHGSIRDAEILATMELGVLALGTNPRKSTRHDEGQKDLVVRFGDVTFEPGAHLYADLDGVVVLPK